MTSSKILDSYYRNGMAVVSYDDDSKLIIKPAFENVPTTLNYIVLYTKDHLAAFVNHTCTPEQSASEGFKSINGIVTQQKMASYINQAVDSLTAHPLVSDVLKRSVQIYGERITSQLERGNYPKCTSDHDFVKSIRKYSL